MLSVNTNAGAATALRALTSIQAEKSLIQNRVSTGLDVSSPKIDGGMWGISQGLRSDITGLATQQDSIARVESTLDVTLAALDGINDLIVEMNGVALALSDTSLDASSFAALEADYNALYEQTQILVANASFNGVNLLDGSTLEMDGLGIDPVAGLNLSSLLASGVTTNPPAVDQFGIFTNVSGTITGSFSGIDNGTFSATVYGDAGGIIEGDLSGTIYGDFSGIVNGNFTGTIYGSFYGILNGANSGTVHNGAVEPPNPFTFDEEHAAMEDFMSGSFTGIAPPVGGDAYAYKAKLTSLKQLREGLGLYSASLGTTLKSASLQKTLIGERIDVSEVARGRLIDADLARDSARLTALQTREQLAVQALSIANSAPSALTRLFA